MFALISTNIYSLYLKMFAVFDFYINFDYSSYSKKLKL
jgi:hypothetical protein